jgi:hypothetical protein
MTLRTEYFFATPGATVKVIPENSRLADYVDYGIPATPVSGEAGKFQVQLNDSEHKKWYAFEGASNPTDWRQWVWEFNLTVDSLSLLTEAVDTTEVVPNKYKITGNGGPESPNINDIGDPTGTGNGRRWTWVTGDAWLLSRDITVLGVNRWSIYGVIDSQGYLFLGPTGSDFQGDYVASNALSSIATGTATIGPVYVEKVRFREDALSKVRRWASGLTLPNEPNPAARRAGAKTQSLFVLENIPLSVPLFNSMEESEIEEIEGLTAQFVVEDSNRNQIHEESVTVEDGMFTIPSTQSFTAVARTLVWSLRRPTSKEYLTGGKINVVYAPVDPS